MASLASREGREAEVRARAAAVGVPLPCPGEAAVGHVGAFAIRDAVARMALLSARPMALPLHDALVGPARSAF